MYITNSMVLVKNSSDQIKTNAHNTYVLFIHMKIINYGNKNVSGTDLYPHMLILRPHTVRYIANVFHPTIQPGRKRGHTVFVKSL